MQSLPERIYLTGFMGSGKTTAGKRLARILGYRFVDLDNIIERQYKTSITLLFEQYDEKAFRLLEQKALHETASFQQTVISTGGGTPCHFDNMDFMLRKGLVVYIHIPPKGLAQRLLAAKRKRPLLSEIAPDGLVPFIEQKLEDRERYYNRANLIVEGINMKAFDLAKKIRHHCLR